MEINFVGALKPTGSPIKISSEGETTVTIVVPATDLAEAIKLTMIQGKLLNISIKVDE